MTVRQRMLRVPEITALFWIMKGLSTAMGESTSDYLVNTIGPVPAVLLGFAAFVVAMITQLRAQRYIAWRYWLAVVMVGVFGTMCADVLHVGFGVSYLVSSTFYAAALATVFLSWHISEKTLSIHAVDTPRREVFYWLAVISTFALGTALGDMVAYTLHLGYFGSAVIFAVIILIPALGYRFRLNAILTFWFAYVVTRPLGASVADWLGKPRDASGLGLGAGSVALVLTILIAIFVGYLTATGRDIQERGSHVRVGVELDSD